MDKTTFEEPAVIDGLGDYVKIKFQAEDPDAEPTYVVLRPEALGASGRQPHA